MGKTEQFLCTSPKHDLKNCFTYIHLRVFSRNITTRSYDWQAFWSIRCSCQLNGRNCGLHGLHIS